MSAVPVLIKKMKRGTENVPLSARSFLCTVVSDAAETHLGAGCSCCPCRLRRPCGGCGASGQAAVAGKGIQGMLAGCFMRLSHCVIERACPAAEDCLSGVGSAAAGSWVLGAGCSAGAAQQLLLKACRARAMSTLQRCCCSVWLLCRPRRGEPRPAAPAPPPLPPPDESPLPSCLPTVSLLSRILDLFARASVGPRPDWRGSLFRRAKQQPPVAQLARSRPLP